MFAHPRLIAWRNRLRRNPLVRTVYAGIAGRGHYEARFSRELFTAVQPGDTVWDIGANIGFYAAQFLERGAAHVVCFEPAPAALDTLRARFTEIGNAARRVHIVPVALGRERSVAVFQADGASPNNRVLEVSSGPTIEVPMLSGDEALRELDLPEPHVIKIDVEGYELEVIEGLRGLLTSHAAPRAVLVEVHFALLHERRLDSAPATLVQRLSDCGFRVRWVDPSHLSARHALR
jgi:FkbM family methyltransferase